MIKMGVAGCLPIGYPLSALLDSNFSAYYALFGLQL